MKHKPCPFCGCKEIDDWPMESWSGHRYMSPVCVRCGATIHQNYGTEETTEAMNKAWDKRSKT
jgi:hypothetical protein